MKIHTILVAFLLSFHAAAQIGNKSDTVVLKGGSQLVGSLTKIRCSDPRVLVIKADENTELSMPQTSVLTITTTLGLVEVNPTGPSETARTYDKSLLESVSPELVSQNLERACRVQSVQSPSNDEPDPLLFRGKITAEAGFTAGTQSRQSMKTAINVSVEAGAKHAENRSENFFNHRITSLRIDGDYDRGAKRNQDFILSSRRYQGHFTQSFIRGRNSIYGFADLLHHFVVGLRLQQQYGVGWQHRISTKAASGDLPFYKQIANNSSFSVDLRWLNQRLYPPDDRFKSFAVGLSQDTFFRIPLHKDKFLIFEERLELVPAFKSRRAFQLRFRGSIAYPITKSMTFGIQFDDDYFGNAPEGRRQNYSKTSLVFGYDWLKKFGGK